MADEQLVISIDSQELTAANECDEKWNLGYVEHWRPVKKAKSLEWGVVMHAMLAHYYRNKLDRYDKDGKLIRKAMLRPEEQSTLIQECIKIGEVLICDAPIITPEIWEDTILRVFKEYILWRQNDGWKVLSVEKPFAVTLYETPKLLIIYTGITDLVAEDPKLGIIVVDHKTEARRSDPFELNNQTQGYFFASGDRPVIINKIGWQKDSTPIDQRFRRIKLDYSEALQREWVNDTIHQVIKTIGLKQDLDKGKRMMKNRSSCDKFTGCMFQRVCREPVEVRDHILSQHFIKKVWDPHTRDIMERTEEPEVVGVE